MLAWVGFPTGGHDDVGGAGQVHPCIREGKGAVHRFFAEDDSGKRLGLEKMGELCNEGRVVADDVAEQFAAVACQHDVAVLGSRGREFAEGAKAVRLEN